MGVGTAALGAEAATVAGAALIGGTSGAAAQVTDNLYEGVPVGEGVTEATAMGAATGGMFQGAGNAIARTYNPYGPVPKMAPPTRTTPQQAAESSAAKESALAAREAELTALRSKAVEEAKKCPCPEEAGGLIIGKPADLISPNVRKFMDGEKQLSDLSAGEIADAIRGYGEFADLAKNDVHKAYQQARIKALKGESPSPGKLLDFMKNYDNTGK
jgi:hypothetical protein